MAGTSPAMTKKNSPRHSGMVKDQTSDVQLHIGESRDSGFARRAPRNDAKGETIMSTTTHAPKQIDPSASLHAESLGLAKSHGRLQGRRIIVVGAGQRNIIDEEPPIGNGRAMSVLFAREGAHVACIDANKEAADNTVAQIKSEGGKAFTHVVDVSDVAAIAPALERCVKT